MISFLNVNKIFTSKSGHKVQALEGLNLHFSSTGLVFILGKSGSGKTTLLSIIGGLDIANSSKILIDGVELKRFDDRTCARYRNTQVGFIFQDYNLMSNLTVYENIALPLRMLKQSVHRSTIAKALEDVGLAGFEQRHLDELSGGQKQRVAIARALIKDPLIVLADEPTGNLDSETSIQIFDLLKSLSTHRLVIVVSHDAEYASHYADRIIELSDGKIVHDSMPEASTEPSLSRLSQRAKLPSFLVFKMSIGNLLHNKLRLAVTTIIVAFLVAILSAVYTALYANASVTEDLIRLSGMDQLLITEPSVIRSTQTFDPTKIEDTDHLRPSILHQLESIATQNKADFMSKTQLMLKDAYLRVESIPFVNWEVKQLETVLIPKPNEILASQILKSTLNFSNFSLDQSRIPILGRTVQSIDEVVVSNYIAELIVQMGLKTQQGVYVPTTIEQLVQDQPILTLSPSIHLKIVGVKVQTAVVLREDPILLVASFGDLYVHPDFFQFTSLKKHTVSYGIMIDDQTQLTSLLEALKAQGNLTVLPRYADQLNRYTRYELTFIMALIVPMIGYFALIFLGNYVGTSITYRKKQIGILRALGADIATIEGIFRIEAFVVGALIMSLVVWMVPFLIDLLNFAFMVHFLDTYISYFHYSIFDFGLSHIIEVGLLLLTVFTVLIFTLTYHINLLDPMDVIRGK